MAIVKFVTSGCPMNNIFPYVMNREKTDENLISGIGCSPDTVLSEFTFVKKQFKKEDGRTYVHIIQAFSPDDDITPETAHEIGLRFAEYFGGFQALVATHRNTDHIHNHIILNSVNMETGKKFHQSAAEMRQVKEYSNRLCREYGLSETETKSSFGAMPKWKSQLRNKAYSVANRTRSKEDFIFEMEMHGYKVDWKDNHKYISNSIQNQRAILEKYAKDNGFENIEVFVDDGYSGVSFNRPDFQRLLEMMEQGKVATLITKDLSRLGRNYIEVGQYTEMLFPRWEVRYIAINDNFDSLYNEGNELAPFKNLFNDNLA